MPKSQLTDDLRRFILLNVPSVPYLEAMLLLQAEACVWRSEEVAHRLYISEEIAVELLRQLHAGGLVEALKEGYRYAPRSPALADVAGRLASVYARHLLEVTHLIHSKSGRRAQEFAEAFNLKKDS